MELDVLLIEQLGGLLQLIADVVQEQEDVHKSLLVMLDIAQDVKHVVHSVELGLKVVEVLL